MLTTYSKEQKTSIIEQLNSVDSIQTLYPEYNVSHITLYRWLKEQSQSVSAYPEEQEFNLKNFRLLKTE